MTKDSFLERFGKYTGDGAIIMPDGAWIPLDVFIQSISSAPSDSDYDTLVTISEHAGYKPFWDKLLDLGAFE